MHGAMKLRCWIRAPSCAPIITASLLGTGIAAGWLGLEGKKESIAGPGGERGHRGYRGHGTPRCTLARTHGRTAGVRATRGEWSQMRWSTFDIFSVPGY